MSMMNKTEEEVPSVIWEIAERTGRMFYVINPETTTFKTEKEIPNYINEAVPIFLSMIVIETLINFAKGNEHRYRFNEAFSSAGHGILQQTTMVITRGVELVGYQWLYDRRYIDLDWSNPWTWFFTALGADFSYYWFHRAVHEVSIFWAAHQVHHSSEDYNLTTALRQSIFQRFFSFGIYQPLALLGIPLPALLVHNQFNLLYQFWIHTEIVSNLGPLEYIFNTASHHRVHHGINKWCLDKNYAGVLIIWDRMFGTFQPERFDDPIVYGLVNQPQKFNVVQGQVFYYRDVFKKAFSMNTWGDKLRALFYGPGWMPGSPRLGDISSLPDKTPSRRKYDPSLPKWVEVYLLIHFFMINLFHQLLVANYQTFSWITVLTYMAFIFVSLGNIGALYDGWWLAPVLESLRCLCWIVYLTLYSVITNELLRGFITAYFTCSTVLWASMSFNTIIHGKKLNKIE